MTSRRKLLIGSFIFSLSVHLLLLGLIDHYSLWFSSSPTKKQDENWLSFVDKKSRDEILEQTFTPKVIEEEPKKKTEAAFEPATALKVATLDAPEQPELFNPSLFQSTFDFSMNEPLVSTSILPTFTIKEHTSINLLDHLPKDFVIPIPEKKKKRLALPFPSKTPVTLLKPKPQISEVPQQQALCFSDLMDMDLSEPPAIARPPGKPPLSELPKLPSLSELDTSSYSDSFDADLVFVKKGDESGYIFALTLIPHPDLNLPKLKQHFTFLIDRANSIQKKRLSATKAALHKALSYLAKEDTFNIIAFDAKVEKMSPQNLPCKGRSLAKAEEFLDKIQLGSFFSTSDLHRPLFMTVPGRILEDEVHTAILFTDGEGLNKKNGKKALLQDWTHYNDGKVSLFTVGMNDANVAVLDAAANLNRGKMINSVSNRGLKRRLQKLLKMIQNPVAKDLVCSAISLSPESSIKIYPKTSKMSHLYLDQPYVILGETSSLDDFILFIQGRVKGRWLNIRKTVSFLNARKGTRALFEEVALQKAYHHYEQYLIDQNPSHITDVEELLNPFNIDIAIQ